MSECFMCGEITDCLIKTVDDQLCWSCEEAYQEALIHTPNFNMALKQVKEQRATEIFEKLITVYCCELEERFAKIDDNELARAKELRGPLDPIMRCDRCDRWCNESYWKEIVADSLEEVLEEL